MSNTSKNLLLWIDIETTGSSHKDDHLLEVACFITYPGLAKIPNGLAKVPNTEQSWVIKPLDPNWVRRMTDVDDPVVLKMHTDNGLLIDVVKNGIDPAAFMEQFMTYISNHMPEGGKFILAGSGVGHFDRPFLNSWWVRNSNAQVEVFTPNYFHYYNIDVGVLRRTFSDIAGRPDLVPAVGDSSKKTHRAIDDINAHWQEYCHYTGLIKNLPKTAENG